MSGKEVTKQTRRYKKPCQESPRPPKNMVKIMPEELNAGLQCSFPNHCASNSDKLPKHISSICKILSFMPLAPHLKFGNALPRLVQL